MKIHNRNQTPKHVWNSYSWRVTVLLSQQLSKTLSPLCRADYNTTQRGNTVDTISQSEPAPTRAVPMQDGCCGTGKHIFTVFLFHS